MVKRNKQSSWSVACAGQNFEAEELVDEFVPRQTFLQEANELLEGALQTQQELERSIQYG